MRPSGRGLHNKEVYGPIQTFLYCSSPRLSLQLQTDDKEMYTVVAVFSRHFFSVSRRCSPHIDSRKRYNKVRIKLTVGMMGQ